MNYEEIAEQFCAHFPARRSGLRRIGREAEYPLCTSEGEAADASMLWPHLLSTGDLTPKFEGVGDDALLVSLDGSDFSFTLEVGRGTIEIVTRPCTDLLELEQIWRSALLRIVTAARAEGLHLLGYGVQPKTPPSLDLMTPKQRYASLYHRMGADWLWYTVSASDQLHVDISRPEMIPTLNLALGLTGAIIALCANSPLHSGHISPFASSREGAFLEGPYANRHGLPPRPYDSYTDFVAFISALPHLLRRDGAQLRPAEGRFDQYLARHGSDLDDFLLHDHYVWQSARLRSAHGTLELRAACQQPVDEPMAAAALYLGIVESTERLIDSLDGLSNPTWRGLQRYRKEAIRYGVRADEPQVDFLKQILESIEMGLTARGRGEESYLQPLWRRLEQKEEPAQRVRRLYRQGGWEGLLPLLAYSSDSLVG